MHARHRQAEIEQKRRRYARERARLRREARAYYRANAERLKREARIRNEHRRLGRDAVAVQYAAVLRGDPCSYCPTGVCEHIEHVEPRARGGANDWTNLTAACASCNSRKGVRSLLDFLRDG